MSNQRSGPITNILRVLETRWADVPTATFASIDNGENFYGVDENARIGDELEVVRPGRNFRPMSMTRGFAYHIAKAPHHVIEEKRGEEMAVRRVRG